MNTLVSFIPLERLEPYFIYSCPSWKKLNPGNNFTPFVFSNWANPGWIILCFLIISSKTCQLGIQLCSWRLENNNCRKYFYALFRQLKALLQGVYYDDCLLCVMVPPLRVVSIIAFWAITFTLLCLMSTCLAGCVNDLLFSLKQWPLHL